MSDRSRGEMRFIRGKPFATRYRNKLELERDFAIGQLVYTPYINGEVFYDTRYGAWSQNRYSAGVQVPAGARIVLETYFLRQHQLDITACECDWNKVPVLFLTQR